MLLIDPMLLGYIGTEKEAFVLVPDGPIPRLETRFAFGMVDSALFDQHAKFH